MITAYLEEKIPALKSTINEFLKPTEDDDDKKDKKKKKGAGESQKETNENKTTENRATE